MLKRLRSQKGQTTTEYLLIISVIVIAMVAIFENAIGPKAKEGAEAQARRLEGQVNKGHTSSDPNLEPR